MTLLSFWVRNGAVALWLGVMAVVLGQNLYRQRREDEVTGARFAL